MKKSLLLLVTLTGFIACGNEKKEEHRSSGRGCSVETVHQEHHEEHATSSPSKETAES